MANHLFYHGTVLMFVTATQVQSSCIVRQHHLSERLGFKYWYLNLTDTQWTLVLHFYNSSPSLPNFPINFLLQKLQECLMLNGTFRNYLKYRVLLFEDVVSCRSEINARVTKLVRWCIPVHYSLLVDSWQKKFDDETLWQHDTHILLSLN